MTTRLLPPLPTTYLSFSVIPFAPNGSSDRAHGWAWDGSVDASPSGLSVSSVKAVSGNETFPLEYVGLSRTDARTLEQFVEDRAGRKDGFWCPTFQHDFYVATHTIGDITLREWGFATNLIGLSVPNSIAAPNYWARHFYGFYASAWMIGHFNGGLHDSGSVDAAGMHVVGYDYAAGAGDFVGTNVTDKTTSAGLAFGRCLFVRFADDAITTSWDHPNLANISLQVTSVLPFGIP